MATGLPVVYPRSGGVPELVGDEAGVGVPHPDGYERDEPPSAEALAAAVTHVLANLQPYSAAARKRGRALCARALARSSRRALRAAGADVAADSADQLAT